VGLEMRTQNKPIVLLLEMGASSPSTNGMNTKHRLGHTIYVYSTASGWSSSNPVTARSRARKLSQETASFPGSKAVTEALRVLDNAVTLLVVHEAPRKSHITTVIPDCCRQAIRVWFRSRCSRRMLLDERVAAFAPLRERIRLRDGRDDDRTNRVLVHTTSDILLSPPPFRILEIFSP
jgi:hypothetical protein